MLRRCRIADHNEPVSPLDPIDQLHLPLMPHHDHDHDHVHGQEPASDIALRVKALESLMFANATLHPAYGKVFYLLRAVSDPAIKDELIKGAVENINKLWAEVDAQLAQQTYICGNSMTPADILLTVIANWGQTFPHKIVMGNNVKRLLKTVSGRPAYIAALAAEKVEYKAAA